MGRAYSLDLRERVVGAVCKGGSSRLSAKAASVSGLFHLQPLAHSRLPAVRPPLRAPCQQGGASSYGVG
jgi:hypothetical protein